MTSPHGSAGRWMTRGPNCAHDQNARVVFGGLFERRDPMLAA